MTLQEFTSTYNLHDSLLLSTDYNELEKKFEITVDFAFWMQDGYHQSDPETGLIKVLFSNVSSVTCSPNIDFDQVSILGTEAMDQALRIMLLNEFTEDTLWIIVYATNVDVIKL